MATGSPKRKTPVGGAGVFRNIQLGGSWILYPRSALGASQPLREFKKPIQRITDISEVVIATGLPALITRAVWVSP
jgi:hypothetical protein